MRRVLWQKIIPVVIPTVYSVLNCCTVESVTRSIPLFAVLPLKGVTDQRTLSINWVFLSEAEEKAEL